MAYQPGRCHILVAVDPPLLGELLARMVADAGVDDVTVVPAAGADDREDREPTLDLTDGSSVYDVAVVTSGAVAGAPAVTVIRLPDATGSAGLASVEGPQGRRAVMLHGLADLLAVLDEVCPAGERRAVQVTAH